MTDHIDRIGQVPPTTPQPVEPKNTEADPSPAFRTLLDSLEKLVRERGPGTNEVDNADDLRDAMSRADDDFKQVMDLRESLEEAFKRRMQ